MATKTFENATLRLKFSLGVNENGQIIEKTKTFRNVSEQASLDNVATVGTALASLYQNQFIGTGLATQEAIRN
ncbi:DUF1659 domain-containing protein [Rummeliibacillus sp. NPDC094406]|uniref:DUF1659 domain-containing protein n=1 Tax=Rummeliibacillus sp. NPDC094406 TaxID=3364511 RepID=UPI0038047A8D